MRASRRPKRGAQSTTECDRRPGGVRYIDDSDRHSLLMFVFVPRRVQDHGARPHVGMSERLHVAVGERLGVQRAITSILMLSSGASITTASIPRRHPQGTSRRPSGPRTISRKPSYR